MAKYSYEFKKMIVDAYVNGAGGYKHLSSANCNFKVEML